MQIVSELKSCGLLTSHPFHNNCQISFISVMPNIMSGKWFKTKKKSRKAKNLKKNQVKIKLIQGKIERNQRKMAKVQSKFIQKSRKNKGKCKNLEKAKENARKHEKKSR